jgi:hypothetical protein
MFAVTSFFSSAIWFSQLRVMIGLSMQRTFAAVWRTFTATGIMSGGVYWFLAVWPYGATIPGKVIALILAVALGGVLYIVPLLGLWQLCGRPAGPEDHAAKAIPQLLARLGLRLDKPVAAGGFDR